MQAWEDRTAFLMDEARRDLEAGADVRPCFVALAGDQRLFLAFLRPFAQGEYLDPLVELIALAAPLGADRLAFSISGRAWSLDDPIPPVLPGVGDLRQRVLTIVEADGSSGSARPVTTGIPFDLVEGQVRWGTPFHGDDTVSAIPAALATAVRNRNEIRGTDREIRAQAERCVALGHLVALAGPIHARLHV
jgi:hypothetical protein